MEREIQFDPAETKKLFSPEDGTKNGQITIIGGSELFHGAPLLSLTVASKIVDMVYFSSPDPSVGEVANAAKSKLFSFIWVPWEDVGKCIEVSGGNAGMAKGGTGDTLAGLVVALFAKNEASLAASCASYITKTAGDELYGKVRTNFNADDLAAKVPEVLGRLQR
ncbi:MAG: Bifunctional NAD(P)H-hydrate repair enzyme Nnr [Candidatus Woesebacteria bacterium GW2011_GWA2_40_7]|uniref:Bifunctional NAD(P)H-hydrate repair enzyme Nnr n=3 Tax=Candidatus Woeseibacteriota TaxID=1752722 RepID=A0A0G0XWJ6_9BACT|nr:MAG: Bifunctional NAD(P)H-hydrate repair enzyme Nnr [Candidatus Woesebacteria bacterium GW2011_GWB1_39_10]KKR72205.1 MAG: Bifunctional NAD(P)H-hydrate repair enzyme Nnr [Candidatus Woesebacteria bacterium GW2011_GWA2_40_7]KKR92267.1 MAG: Bifunctional NAD(P)H-hydrate repair enzyme Nnr [Candidatus Woesebacteria bacterium GW2011_GWA1_41_13b]